jgi:hypothetical protein
VHMSMSAHWDRIVALLARATGLQVLVIIVFALLVSMPCLVGGIPSGCDAGTHVQYQNHFSKQF